MPATRRWSKHQVKQPQCLSLERTQERSRPPERLGSSPHKLPLACGPSDRHWSISEAQTSKLVALLHIISCFPQMSQQVHKHCRPCACHPPHRSGRIRRRRAARSAAAACSAAQRAGMPCAWGSLRTEQKRCVQQHGACITASRQGNGACHPSASSQREEWPAAAAAVLLQRHTACHGLTASWM